jgi:hypothetical protein
MGIKDLEPLLRDPKLKKKPTDRLVCERLKGLTVGINTSTFLHAAIANQPAANAFHAKPSIPVVHVAQYLRNALGLFKKAEVTPIIYFDGCHHIHKAATDAGRRIIVELNALLVAARPSDYNDVARLRKNSVVVREDIVAEAVEFLRSERFTGVSRACW